MSYILTTTILSYFHKIHNQTIDNNNALELLEKLKEFEQIHQSYKNQFTPFRGLLFETIEEVIKQDIHRISNSQKLYVANGNLLTPNTKQRDIERKNKDHQSQIDTKAIGGEIYQNIMKPSPTTPKKLSISEQARRSVEKQKQKDNLIRKNK